MRLKHGEFFVQYANSNVNFYYATKFKVSNALHIMGSDANLLVVHEMEKRRAERESSIEKIVSLWDLDYYKNLREIGDAKKALAHTYVELLKSYGTKKVLIPPEFPSFLSFYFREHIKVEVVENPFSRLRAVKSRDELKKIKESSIAAIDALNYLLSLFKKRDLRCEELRNRVETYLFLKGFLAEDTIVASGELTADPHFMGKGEIEEHVIVDIFPKSRTHGYYADFTRTVIIEENKEIESMLEAVIEAKKRAISVIREGVEARDVHHAVCDVLESRGYHTLRNKAKEGFIHSTGHGVGLEVHEEPKILENENKLKSGMVFTIEPGLYYKKLGGVRTEDVVVVTKHGCEVLTSYPDRVDLG